MRKRKPPFPRCTCTDSVPAAEESQFLPKRESWNIWVISDAALKFLKTARRYTEDWESTHNLLKVPINGSRVKIFLVLLGY